MRHHEIQQKGRDEILADYHLRVGQITADNQVPSGYTLTEQRFDETEVGEGTTVTLINAIRRAEWKQTEPLGGREYIVGRIRRGADARQPDPAHLVERRECSAGL